MSQLKSQIKPFDISKWEVKKAWEEVRANKGAPGVDGQSIEDFEKDLQGNLYKIWSASCQRRLKIEHGSTAEI
jgi:RNA-directed DNA polymerase